MAATPTPKVDWYEDEKVMEPMKRAYNNLEGILEYPDEFDDEDEVLNDLQAVIDTLQEAKQALRRRVKERNG